MEVSPLRRCITGLMLGLVWPALAQAGSRPATLRAAHAAQQVMFPRAALQISEASPLQLPGPGVDSNSPAHWTGTQFHVFTSWFAPQESVFRSSGSGIVDLDSTQRAEVRGGERTVAGGRWLEATYKDPNGTLYGWYHIEPIHLCRGTSLTAPRIGAFVSFDDGLSWLDLGVILEAPAGSLQCEAANGFFAGGHGDFSVILDEEQRFFYFLFSNYSGTVEEQGVALARMPYMARYAPAGNVVKWYQGDWQEPGLGGRVTPVLAAARSWMHADPDAFWGPAVHWNTHLRTYVILLNRTQGGNGDWRQEGVYAVLAERLSDPRNWTEPQRILAGGSWYPQVIGVNGEARETDKLAGPRARLFMSGASDWEITFALRPHVVRASAGPCGSSVCITLLGSNFGATPSVDIRTNTSDLIVATVAGESLRQGYLDGQQVLAFHLEEHGLLQEFGSGGLRFFVVSPATVTWSDPVPLNAANVSWPP